MGTFAGKLVPSLIRIIAKEATKINSYSSLFNSSCSSNREIFIKAVETRREIEDTERNAWIFGKNQTRDLPAVKLASNISWKTTSPNSHSSSGRWKLGSWEGSGTNSVIEFLAARNPITRQIPIEFSSGEEKNRGSIYA